MSIEDAIELIRSKYEDNKTKNGLRSLWPTRSTRFGKLRTARSCCHLLPRKNHDYGDSFHIAYLKWGLLMAAIRLGDKYQRFETLIRAEQQVQDESIRDTLIDLANYAVMSVMELDRLKAEAENEKFNAAVSGNKAEEENFDPMTDGYSSAKAFCHTDGSMTCGNCNSPISVDALPARCPSCGLALEYQFH